MKHRNLAFYRKTPREDGHRSRRTKGWRSLIEGVRSGENREILFLRTLVMEFSKYPLCVRLATSIELATSNAPPSNAIPGVVNEAREMTWKFIENFL